MAHLPYDACFRLFCSVFKVQHKSGGDEENRTPDPLLARQVLSQLSYAPAFPSFVRSYVYHRHLLRQGCVRLVDIRQYDLPSLPCLSSHLSDAKSYHNYLVGLSGLEPLTSRLSGVRSNQLSYRPVFIFHHRHLHDAKS